MKMDFPQVDLPTEVLAWTNVTEDILNIYKQSCRLQACIVAICTEGSMKFSFGREQKKYAFVLPASLLIVPDGSIS